jgi:hypothetical protein
VFRCAKAGCQKDFTMTMKTVMERSHIPLHKWLLGFHLFTASKKGFSAHQLHRTLGITYRSAWFMAHRIREANDTVLWVCYGRKINPRNIFVAITRQQLRLFVNRMAQVIAAITDFLACGQDAVHGADRAVVDALVEQAGVDFGGCLIGKARRAQKIEHGLSFHEWRAIDRLAQHR